MTYCEICINYDMCKAKHDSLDETVLSFFPNNSDCQFFKNKADFVKVVRCCDCKHWVYLADEKKCSCNRTYCYTNRDDFCSYGERK